MSLRDCSIFTLVMISLQVVTLGQNQPAQTAPAQDQGTPQQGDDASRSTPAPALTGLVGIDSSIPQEDSSSGLPAIPSLLGGPQLSLELGAETERSNYLRGGLNVGAAYDSNAFLTPNDAKGNTTFSGAGAFACQMEAGLCGGFNGESTAFQPQPGSA